MKKKNFFHHSELPVKNDRANTFLEISIAVSIFLFSITLAAYFVISSMLVSWNRSIVDGLSVQIMPSKEVLSEEEDSLRVGKVLQFFEGISEVQSVQKISDAKIQKLMAPWIGTNADIQSLPFPKLLDVRLHNGRTFDYEKTALSLKEIAPYASIDNHRIWLQKLIKSAASLKMLSVFILALVLSASACSIVFAVQTSLKIHQSVIEILHIMGATDSYIAKQYGKRMFFVSLFSSLVGTILSALALLIIAKMSTGFDAGLIACAKLSMFDWSVILSLPLWTAFFAMITAWFSVKHSLGKII